MKSVECFEGEQIEEKVRRIVNNNEPITDGAPIIFTEKKDGIRPEYNIRTDKWALAMDAMDKVNNYKLNEYLKKEETEKPKTAEGQAEGEVTETSPTRDN